MSVRFAANKLPKAIQSDPSYACPPDLKIVADAFVRLQQSRHEADYDLTRNSTRAETLSFAQRVSQAFAPWNRIKKSDEARLYLASFLLWERWDKDPR